MSSLFVYGLWLILGASVIGGSLYLEKRLEPLRPRAREQLARHAGGLLFGLICLWVLWTAIALAYFVKGLF